MGALTFTLDQQEPQPAGAVLRVTGFITFSSSYGPSYETYDPADIGLQTVLRIVIDPPWSADNSDGLIATPVNTAPVESTKFVPPGTPLGQIAVLTTPNGGGPLTLVSDTTPLQTYKASFVAWGY